MAGRDEIDIKVNHDKMLGSLYCKKAISLPQIPNEGTGHIDLFAKFLSDDTVYISNYESSDIKVQSELKAASLSCSDEQIANKSWHECTFMKISTEKLGVPSRLLRSKEEVIDLEKKLFPSGKASEPYLHADLVSFSRQIAEIFKSQNFNTLMSPAPHPELIYAREDYRDKQGKLVKSELLRSFIHRSFANSTIVNEHLFLSVYKTMGEDKLAAEAESLFSDAGFTVHPIDMSHSIQAGGGVHCLTMQLP